MSETSHGGSGGLGGTLVGLVRRLPGFRGYFELEERRASDTLLREHLASELERAKRSTDQAARGLADAGLIDPLPQFDQLRGQIDRVTARLRGAPRGYSGLFDLRRVDAKLLEDIYAHDQTLIDQVNTFRTLVDGWASGPQAAVSGLAEARQKLDLIDRGCDARADLLKRFVESHSQAT